MTGRSTLDQIERRPDGPQARPRPITSTAWEESRLAVIGTWGLCWCGRQQGHDWPGKNTSAPHPREGRVSTMPEDVLADLRRAAEVLGCDLVIIPPDRDQERPADGP